MEASDYLRPHWVEELELEYQAAIAEGWPYNDCDECEEGIKKGVK